MSKLADLQKKLGLTPDGILGKQSFTKIKESWQVTDEQLAHLLGQAEHESGHFKSERENVNYSADGLRKIFPKYFTAEQATSYARKPELIASRTYANRMGNGDEASKDGWKYRGAGSLQLTGKSNFKEFSDFIKEDCVANPDLVGTKYYFESALFFFKKNGLLPIAATVTKDAITKVSKRVNGGTIGLDERIKLTNEWYKKIKQAFLFLFITLFLSSCAARKVNVDKVDSVVKSDSTSVTKQEVVTTQQNNVTITTDTDELEIVPVSDTIPMVVNGITYKNAKLRYKKTKNVLVDTSKIKVAEKTSIKVEVKKEAKVKTFKKAIEKESSYAVYIWWILIIIILIYLYNRFKSKFLSL